MVALEERPHVPAGFEWVWLGFCRLSESRSGGLGGVEPIRPEAIAAYLDIHGISDLGLRAEFYRLVTAVDSQWRSAAAKKSSE